MGAYKSNLVVLLLTTYFKLILCQGIDSTIQDVISNFSNLTRQLNPARGMVNIHGFNLEAIVIPIRTGERGSVRINDLRKKIVKKFLRGFTIDTDGKCVLTAKRVAKLKSSHFDFTDPQPSDEFKFNYTFSENAFELMKHGVNDSSLSLDSIAYSDRFKTDAHSIGQDEYSASNSTITLFTLRSFLHKKKQIGLHPFQLSMDSSLFAWTVDAISEGLVNIQSAENLVKLLNQYGWYSPTKFVVGGAKLEIQKQTVKVNEAINDFTVTFQSAPSTLGANPSSELQSTTEEIERTESGMENAVYTDEKRYEFVGGIADENDALFTRSLHDDPDNWDIIEYVEFMPTLKLLYYQNPFLFGHCLKLLKEFHSHSQIKDLQKFINIHDYAMKLELETSQAV